jgi:hypothetical protein
VLGVLPVALVCAFTVGVIGDHYAFDFHTFWTSTRKVLHGSSPYPSPALVAHAHPTDGAFEYFVYPPPFVLAMLPFAVLPFAAAAALYTLALLASIAGALWILGVRDWRCYGIAFASIPTLSGLRLGAVTPLLVFLAALAWRHRDRAVVAGASVAAAVVVKLFLWPLGVWLLLTRRRRATAVAVAGSIAVTAVAWAAIGFDGLHRYPELLRSLSRTEAAQSYSLVAAAARLGVPSPRGSWLAVAIPAAAALVLWAVRTGRDEAVFSATLIASLLLTPILWLHYFALLLVPVAIRQPRLGRLWILPLLYWVSPIAEPEAHPLWRIVVVVALAVVVAVTRPPAPHPAPAA